jgi:hypothetical protein
VTTNYNGLIISVLEEPRRNAVGEGARRTVRWPRPPRGMRTVSVATGQGARPAAAVSLLLASAKTRDHLADGDAGFSLRPVALMARGVARRWDRAGGRTGAGLGFDTTGPLNAIGRQAGTESAAGPGHPLLAVTEPTKTATAATFGRTAVLAGQPGNRTPLDSSRRTRSATKSSTASITRRRRRRMARPMS